MVNMKTPPLDSWSAFEQTIIEIDVDGLAVSVSCGSDVPAALLRRGTCHVITAWNPGAQVCARVDNDRAHAELLADVESIPARWLAACGRSPDGSWSEPSLCIVGLGRERALELGRRYGQLAIFEVGAAGVEVLPCGGPRGR
jgi:hypothetical protein